MGFEIINKLKKEKGLTNAQLSKLSGVTLSTLDKITSGANTNPKLDTLQAICRALGCRLDDFDDTPPQAKKAPLYSSEAMDIARRYSGLDIYGKDTIRAVMETEENRIKEQAELDAPPAEPKIIPLFWSASAAGIASPILGEDFDNYELKEEDPQGAMFAIKVQGDSMEPYFPDGSIAFCNKDPLQDGDIGVFSVDGGSVIKQYHYDRFMGMTYLFSLNRNRSDADVVIPRSTGQTLVCQGRVITRRRYPLPK